jgi:short-subunit dehydrogenase
MAARRGAKLVLAARNEDALRQISDEINAAGGQAMYVVADVASEADVRRVAEQALQRFGRFDSWLNLAGVGIFGANEQVSIDDMRRLFDINFWGVVYGSLAALPQLKSHGGALINMGSEASDRAVPLQGIYSASKHAVKGFTDSLRVELEHQRAPVSVTLIKPASIDTMFVAHSKNYMEVEPSLPPPVYAPETVAEALLYAAEHPVRDLYIGGRAKVMGASAHYMPRVLDKGMQRFMYRLMKTDQPARNRDDHNLYSYRADLHERGGLSLHPRERSYYTTAMIHPVATKALMVGAGLALAAMWQSRRHAGMR